MFEVLIFTVAAVVAFTAVFIISAFVVSIWLRLVWFFMEQSQ
jgi:hypothetical protein